MTTQLLECSVSFQNPQSLSQSSNEKLVKRIFGLPLIDENRLFLSKLEVPVKNLTYITGYSGSGKSSILREIALKMPDAVVSSTPSEISKKVVDCFSGELAEVIQWLSWFGLGEARVLTTRCDQLSVGQKERLNLALLLWKKPKQVIIDEFLSSLDRVTARAIAYQFQKIVRKLNIVCFVATAHCDLTDALFPDTLVTLDFEGEANVSEPEFLERRLPEIREVLISEGSVEDYIALKRFHYMDHQIGDQALKTKDIVCIRKAVFRGKLIGVRVFTKPFPTSYERMEFFRSLNEKIYITSRVIVHPAFRGLGVSRLLDLSQRPNSNVKLLCTQSALAKYFPFDSSSGYQTLSHFSEAKTVYHAEYESLLKRTGVQPEELNDPAFCQKFWEKLGAAEQKDIVELVANILADYDLRYAKQLAQYLKIQIPKSAEDILFKLFRTSVLRTPVNNFWTLLSDALHFPMQGLVKFF